MKKNSVIRTAALKDAVSIRTKIDQNAVIPISFVDLNPAAMVGSLTVNSSTKT